MRRACTIIARNYWAHARVLARSLEAHHPGLRLCVLVVDATDAEVSAAQREPFDVLVPEQIGIDRRELHRMAAIYDVLELSTALKPFLLRHLIADDSAAAYLDPDIEVFGPLDQAFDAAHEHGIVVTPHATAPPSGPDGDHEEELTILGSGTYNLGFIAVGPSAEPFLAWWGQRLRREGLIAKEAGMFVDQRWVDLAPSYFGVHILRGAGWNVAYWNLPSRRLERRGESYLVDGEPLVFFHYSGFHPDRPDVLSSYEPDPPKVRPGDVPALGELCGRYGRALIAAGFRAHMRSAYGFAATAAGLPLDRYARRLYRRALLAAESSGQTEPPDPFDPRTARAFEVWLFETVGEHRITRYLRGIFDERGDLQVAFPDLAGPDGRFFMDWARTRGRFEPNVEPELITRAAGVRRHGPDAGVNVAGYLHAESGVGAVARLLVRALDAAGIPRALRTFDATASRQHAPAPEGGEPPTHPVSIVCVNADAMQAFVERGGDGFVQGRRTIGVWQWEVERFPEEMARATEHVDEVWVSSEHAAAAVRGAVEAPVHVFPLPVLAPRPSRRSRASLSLPEGFLFLFCFDFDSVFERKNPLAVIAAFSRAFPPGSGPHLVIKTVRGHAHPEKLAPLRAAAAERPDITVMDGYLDEADQAALMAHCDAYVSLHRAEGFGLTLAEAMALGKPVVATGYSGTLEFMDDTNSRLVPYELVAIPEGCAPYPPGARWAEPDIDAAAAMLRELVEDPAGAAELGRRAADDIRRLHAPACRAAFLRRRLADDPQRADAERMRRETNARAWLPVESVDVALSTGPDVRSPTGYGALSRLVRRIVLRVARHYVEHQERIQTTMLEGVRELEARLRAEIDAARELEGEVRDLHGRLDRESRRRQLLEELVSGSREQGPGGAHRWARLFPRAWPVAVLGPGAPGAAAALSSSGCAAFEIENAGDLAALTDASLGGVLVVGAPADPTVLSTARAKLVADGVLLVERAGESDGLVDACRSSGFERAYAVGGESDGVVIAAGIAGE